MMLFVGIEVFVFGCLCSFLMRVCLDEEIMLQSAESASYLYVYPSAQSTYSGVIHLAPSFVMQVRSTLRSDKI